MGSIVQTLEHYNFTNIIRPQSKKQHRRKFSQGQRLPDLATARRLLRPGRPFDAGKEVLDPRIFLGS